MANKLIEVAKHKQLFLDDYAVETMDGLVRTLHPVDKQGPVIEPDESTGQLAVQSNSPPIWNPDRGLYEWWFGARYSSRPQGAVDEVHGHPGALRHVGGRAGLGPAQPWSARVGRIEGQQSRPRPGQARSEPHPPRRARPRPDPQVQGHVRRRPPGVRCLARRVRLDDARRTRPAQRGHVVHALRRVHGAVSRLPQAQHGVGPGRSGCRRARSSATGRRRSSSSTATTRTGRTRRGVSRPWWTIPTTLRRPSSTSRTTSRRYT